MLFSEKPIKAGAGTNTISIMMPIGAIVKHITCRNETKPWQNMSIALSEDGTINHRYFSLTGRRSQPGANRDVVWQGEIRMDPPFIYVLGTLSNCDAADVLWLVVGYELPIKKRGWGD